MPKNFESNPELRDKSRELRRNMTFEERQLWYHFLRNYEIHFSIDDFLKKEIELVEKNELEQ